MPFAGFEDFDDCVRTMRRRRYTSDEAKRICGRLQADYEKGFIKVLSSLLKENMHDHFWKGVGELRRAEKAKVEEELEGQDVIDRFGNLEIFSVVDQKTYRLTELEDLKARIYADEDNDGYQKVNISGRTPQGKEAHKVMSVPVKSELLPTEAKITRNLKKLTKMLREEEEARHKEELRRRLSEADIVLHDDLNVDDFVEWLDDLLHELEGLKHSEKWHSCVEKVAERGDVDSPEAVCTAVLGAEHLTVGHSKKKPAVEKSYTVQVATLDGSVRFVKVKEFG